MPLHFDKEITIDIKLAHITHRFIVENHLKSFLPLYLQVSKQFFCPTVYHCSMLREFEEMSLRWRSKKSLKAHSYLLNPEQVFAFIS